MSPAAFSDPHPLTLLTYNVWGLPKWINGASADRFGRIADELERLRPDIVLLQEVWTSRARDVLPDGDWWVASTERRFPFWGRNGLVLLSRFEMLGGEFRPFEAGLLPDSIMSKGALKTTLQLAGGDRVNVWNVHLQAGASATGRAARTRSRQIRELREWVHEAKDDQVADIVGGDFNCTPGSANFHELEDAFGPALGTATGETRRATYGWLDARPGEARALDHMFVLARPGWRLRGTHTGLAFDSPRLDQRLSDHRAVTAAFWLRPSPQLTEATAIGSGTGGSGAVFARIPATDSSIPGDAPPSAAGW
ncbi:MAG: endonuclease/exonuclease/phosphatase family protein [Verrucomicrobiales bacterium]|nr:endonuclease/exonuclease/phosphatase family protein [Verrucomicrobiales bacterium]